jgi:hypothetical protein
MPTFEEYERRVAELETGHEPARREDIYALLNGIFMAQWETAEDRNQAQGLIRRLELLSWQGKPVR